MAAFNNVVVSGDDWVDINTLSGAPVGGAISIQNVGTASVFLQESTTKPLITNNNGGVLFTAEYGDLSNAVVASGSLKMWAKLKDANKPTTLSIFE